jgi:anti-sigma regulatory factor (Ser/Thr protein kinase)
VEPDSLIRSAKLENLDTIVGFVEEYADSCGLASKRKFGLLVAIEEAFVNICHYAYPVGAGDVKLTCSCDEEDFAVEIADSGIPFDVLSAPEPDTAAGITDRAIGGLGVHFIRKMTDEVSYRREAGRNILRLVLLCKKNGVHDD